MQGVRMKYQMGSVGDVDKLHAEANQAASESISAVRVVQVVGGKGGGGRAPSLQAEAYLAASESISAVRMEGSAHLQPSRA